MPPTSAATDALDTLPFASIPLIDNHAHPWLAPARAAAEPLARFFTEADTGQPDTLFYHYARRELASVLGCAPTEAALQAAHQQPDLPARLAQAAGLETILVDDGYPRQDAVSVDTMAQLSGCRVRRILRIETLAEDLIAYGRRDLAQLETAFVETLETERPHLAALKSIIAYRGGLAVEPANADRAAHALQHLAPGRLTARPLLEYLLQTAADWAAEHQLPLQLHTGFGDRDLDLRLSNPLHLRPQLEAGALGRGPLVLLHAGYPYVRETGYLVGMYPSLHVDLSLAAPLLPPPALARAIEDLLALAPCSRVLYGSDAWGIPDWLFLAASAARRGLGQALGWLGADKAAAVARLILHDNAVRLYQLG